MRVHAACAAFCTPGACMCIRKSMHLHAFMTHSCTLCVHARRLVHARSIRVHSASCKRLQHPFKALALCVLGCRAAQDLCCTHEVAVTALHITDAMCVEGKTSFDETYLKTLLEKVSAVSRASHRPRNTVGGAHIQPRDDIRLRMRMRTRVRTRRAAMTAATMKISPNCECQGTWL